MIYQDKQGDGAVIIILILAITYLLFTFITFHDGNVRYPPYGDKRTCDIAVRIFGKNMDGGVYFVSPNTTLRSFLDALKIKDLSRFNKVLLNMPLKQAQTLALSTNNQLYIGEMTVAQKLILDIPIDINRITVHDLTLIPDIGIQKARQIILFREKTRKTKAIEDLMRIRGIKAKTFKKIKGYFCAENDCPR
jgi:DNA uptake protein ComE-like DNA-binding protein